MRFTSFLLRSASLSVVLSGALLPFVSAQTFAATTGVVPPVGGNIPKTVPSALPSHQKKTDAPLMYARVRDGIYSVDGMVGKVQLNYDVQAANYLYFFIPGVGTALVSLAPSPDAIWTPSNYTEGELKLKVGEHTVNLTGVESLVNEKGKQPENVYVRLDRESWKLSRTPMMGFGKTLSAPYEWPAALPAKPSDAQTEVPVLPMPASVLPRKVSYQVPPAALR